jgi:predicted phosphodiesterase
VSDFHGNLAALDAVVADLRSTSPDLVVQAGDTAVLGPRPAEVVDRLRELTWPALVGNTDEMLWNLACRAEQERRAPKLRSWLNVLFGVLGPWAAERLGDDRLAWLRSLPAERRVGNVRVVHASPGDLWRAPMPEATDVELAGTYGGGEVAVAVYGHVHRPFVRSLPGLTVANSGSVGLPWDGDWRPSYLLVDGDLASVRRVPYNLERARRELATSGFPLVGWLETMQRDGRFTRPA